MSTDSSASSEQSLLQPYQVALLSHDLTSSETVLDMLHALDHLALISQEIFQRIDIRITEEKNRITTMKQRIKRCNDIVDRLRGRNSAITVFSTAKYPAPKELPAYPTLLGRTSLVSYYNPSIR